MPGEDQETRLRDLERSTAVLAETMRSIQSTLSDIKQQIGSFLDKAQLALAVEARVEGLEKSVAELFRKSDAAFKSIDAHKSEYASLKAEHGVCMQAKKTESSWWKDRLGRVLDAGAIALVIWFLAIYKSH